MTPASRVSILATLVSLAVGTEMYAQVADWPKVFEDLTGPDAVASAAARKMSFETLIPSLQTESAAALRKDVQSIIRVFDNPDQRIRLQASGLLYAVATLRSDGTESLQDAFPILVSLFLDQNPRTKENAVRCLAGLRPEVPLIAVPAFIDLRYDKSPTVQSAAIYAIARSALQSADAVKALKDLLVNPPAALRLETVREIGFAHVPAPAIIGTLRQILGEDDHTLVKATIETLAKLGPSAVDAEPELEKIFHSQSDKELRGAASTALAQIHAK